MDPKLTYAEKERRKEGEGLKGRRERKCEREGGRRREGKKGLSVKKIQLIMTYKESRSRKLYRKLMLKYPKLNIFHALKLKWDISH